MSQGLFTLFASALLPLYFRRARQELRIRLYSRSKLDAMLSSQMALRYDASQDLTLADAVQPEHAAVE